jgi:hypothetical protein
MRKDFCKLQDKTLSDDQLKKNHLSTKVVEPRAKHNKKGKYHNTNDENDMTKKRNKKM